VTGVSPDGRAGRAPADTRATRKRGRRRGSSWAMSFRLRDTLAWFDPAAIDRAAPKVVGAE